MRSTPLHPEENKDLRETLPGDTLVPMLSEEESRALGVDRAQFESFSQIFSRRAEERYVRRLSSEQLRKNMAGMLNFISERSPEEIKVRVLALHELGLDPSEELVAIETCMEDQPFIVDTLKLAFTDFGAQIAYAVTMLPQVQRDATGRLVSLHSTESGATTESVTRFVLSHMRGEEARGRLESDCLARLTIARDAVKGYQKIRRLSDVLQADYKHIGASKKERDVFQEASEFIGWLLEDNFVYFGAHYFNTSAQITKSVGAADALASKSERNQASLGRFFAADQTSTELVRVRRSEVDAKMHRAGKVCQVLIRTFDDDGKPNGGVVLYGLLTRKALRSQGDTIPIVRRRLETILREEDAVPESYHYRAIRNAFNSLPVEFLLEAPTTNLKVLVTSAARAENARESVVHVSLEPERQTAFAFVIISEDFFNDTLRESLQEMLTRATHAKYSDHRVSVGFGRSIGLYFYLTDCDLSGLSHEELEARLLPLCTPWSEQLERALRAAYDGETAQRLQDRYEAAFSLAYQRTTSPDSAVRDIKLLEGVYSSGGIRFDFFQEASDVPVRNVRLRLYHKGELFLSEILPILDQFGFRVIDQESMPVLLSDGASLSMETFRISAGDSTQQLLSSKTRLVDGLEAVFRGDVVSDPLNRLMVRAGLRWAEVDMLRALLGYAMQIRPNLVRESVQRVLAARPEATRALVDLFHARFAPDAVLAQEGVTGKRADNLAAAQERLADRLRHIQDATEYRVLKVFENLLNAIVRTNFYRADRKSHYLSFKIECSRLEVVPDPRPKFEIFVNSATMEGVHLRGGKVARGGIRWSDRLEDYRTEIFGLMRTQMVKNVLIVPVGAKGGFILKNEKPGTDRRAFADQMYEILVRGLLDVTDNIVAGKIVPAPNVVAHDELDPYLVVAADKGTAHLSDTANRVSAEYGFWLQDAFASGGSAGYDHKIYAITAKGAWACSKHLFSFLDLDPEKDPIRVVGVGDMSGDVFGNGMLLSSSMKVVGAFDHRHIFLDPNPDAAISFAERKRMFDLPRSSWADYKREALSAGGGVFSRTEKEIPLSPECQALLGVTDAALPPETVIRKLLTLDVDLLWNGGIGTFIKSSEEDHAAVGDRVNDVLRVDGRDVRAKVIGEGGNLGVTQRGRIEYARHGGRINTDAIDNSGGVDLSDHEVNLKILLSPLVASGALSIPDRNKLLKEIAHDVCDRVVENNNANALLLSLDEIRSKRDPYAFVRAIRFLEEHGVGIPKSEQVPSEQEMQARGLGLGFFRPELAKIAPYIKMYVSGELLAADPRKFPDNDRILFNYFPEVVNNRYQDAIEKHMLLNEILSTMRTNELAEFAGITFFPDLVVETDRPVADVALAYTLAMHSLGAEALRKQLLETPGLKAEARYQAIIYIEEGLREATSWLLHFLPGDMLWKRAQVLARKKGSKAAKNKPDYASALQALREQLPQAASRAWSRVEQDVARLQELGLSDALAHEVGLSNQWAKVFPIAELGESSGRSLSDVARSYLALGQKTQLNALILRIGRQPATDNWEALALRGLRASLLRLLKEFTQQVLAAKIDPDEALEQNPTFLSLGEEIARANPSGGQRKGDSPVSVAVLVVVAEKLRKGLDRLQLGAKDA